MTVEGQAGDAHERIERFAANLRLLNDVLAGTAFGDRYFLWGGLLLGWAREGRILPHDAEDADIGYFLDDRETFLAAVPALVAAGFQPARIYTNSAGLVTQHKFLKDQAGFDIFGLQREGTRARYWVYAPTRIRKAWIELVGLVSVPGFTTMRFLDRTWRIPADHEGFLRAMYGAWRVPKPDFNCILEEGTIVRRYLWTGAGEPVTWLPPGARDFSQEPVPRPRSSSPHHPV